MVTSSTRQDIQGHNCKVPVRKIPWLKQQLYRGHLWNPSYYIGTAGDVTKDVIRKYIEMQRTKSRERVRK